MDTMNDLAKRSLAIAKGIHTEIPQRGKPPAEGLDAETEQIIPLSYVSKSRRGYIIKVANQINGCYERGWFDACAVMMRRLIETLIIEAFERNNLDHKIKDAQGDFLRLDELLGKAQAEWNLSRSTKRKLPDFIEVSNQCAHSRRFNAHSRDIDRHIITFRNAVQEFLAIAKLN